MSDRGLALPRELPVRFPEPPDFSVGAFHNRSAHTQSIHEDRSGASGRARLIPIIHRALSLVGRYRYTRARAESLRAAIAAFAGRTMRAFGNRRGARTISIALVAGLAAFEAVLVCGAGAIGIPGVLLVRFADKGGDSQTMPNVAAFAGGESFMAKVPVPAEPEKPTPDEEPAKPASTPPDPAAEPRLAGLADIPLKPWVSEKPKADEANPDAPKAFAANSGGKEVLPWDAVEPYRFSPDGAAAADATASLPAPSAPETPRPPAIPIALPKPSAVEGWVKAKATEIKGEERGHSLYHFEFWLDAPDEVKRRLVTVAYEFNTPAVMPQSQVSSEGKTGFRIFAGGLTCADKVTVTLKFNDGQSQQVAVDGCRLVS